MKRRLTTEVKDAAEFEAIQRGLSDPEALAFVKIIGYLQPFEKRQQQAIMTAVTVLEDARLPRYGRGMKSASAKGRGPMTTRTAPTFLGSLGAPFEMDPDQLGEECRELIDIIAAEFESDPMSVQCFDLRIVERAKRAAKIHRRYRRSLFK